MGHHAETVRRLLPPTAFRGDEGYVVVEVGAGDGDMLCYLLGQHGWKTSNPGLRRAKLSAYYAVEPFHADVVRKACVLPVEAIVLEMTSEEAKVVVPGNVDLVFLD